MLRRTIAKRFNLNISPEVHRFSQSTFHEGSHRQAPGDSTPWRDVATPYHKLKAWWLAPAAKGSIIAAWSIAVVIFTYAYSLQQDAKATYMLNNVLLRNLHQESLRADANQTRADELQLAVKAKLVSEAEKKANLKKTLEQCADSKVELQQGIVNYELELAKEKARSEIAQERNQALVAELLNVRSELQRMKKDNTALVGEVEKLRKSIRRLETA